MELKTKEHYEVIEAFEADMKRAPFFRGHYTKEDKALWAKGHVYTHGETNAMFLAYRYGVAYGKFLERA